MSKDCRKIYWKNFDNDQPLAIVQNLQLPPSRLKETVAIIQKIAALYGLSSVPIEINVKRGFINVQFSVFPEPVDLTAHEKWKK